MSGLSRVIALYRLLELVHERDASLAGAAVAETELELGRLQALRETLAQEARAGAEDPVARSAAALGIRSCSVLHDRVKVLERQRTQAREDAMAELARSRVSVRQVETVLEQHREAREEEADKRSQAAADERFLSQRYQRRLAP